MPIEPVHLAIFKEDRIDEAAEAAAADAPLDEAVEEDEIEAEEA